MAKKLFVGNLSYEVTDDDLRTLFAQAGTCESASVVLDRDTGQSRGFGFVMMATADDAERAKRQFDGTDLKGRAYVSMRRTINPPAEAGRAPVGVRSERAAARERLGGAAG